MDKMVTLSKNQKLTKEQKKEVREAAKRPIVFDEDSPHLTPKTLLAFKKAARKRNSIQN